jgi:hypothetical protein
MLASFQLVGTQAWAMLALNICVMFCVIGAASFLSRWPGKLSGPVANSVILVRTIILVIVLVSFNSNNYRFSLIIVL